MLNLEFGQIRIIKLRDYEASKQISELAADGLQYETPPVVYALKTTEKFGRVWRKLPKVFGKGSLPLR